MLVNTSSLLLSQVATNSWQLHLRIRFFEQAKENASEFVSQQTLQALYKEHA